jgi:transcriptional regulator with XRE-family HTH domain
MRDAAAACSSAEESQFPLAVSHAVLSGVNPIRAWREHLGLPQDELGQRMGTSKSGVCRLEQAERPKRSTLERVATALGLDDPAQLIKLY